MCGGDDNSAVESLPQKRHKTGFRGPSPDVGKATQIKPGEVRNPGGRPSKDLAAVLAVRAYELISNDSDALNKAAAKVAKMIISNPKMAQVMADRGFGKVPQTINVEGELTIANRVSDILRSARKRLGEETVE